MLGILCERFENPPAEGRPGATALTFGAILRRPEEKGTRNNKVLRHRHEIGLSLFIQKEPPGSRFWNTILVLHFP